MLLFKACPRCEGDMHVSGDIYGDYKECLMCGLMVDIAKDDDMLSMVDSLVKTRFEEVPAI